MHAQAVSPTHRPGRILLAGVALLLTTSVASAGDDSSRPVDFNRDIRPILSNNCFLCHGPDPGNRKGGAEPLRLDTEEGATADRDGSAAIVRGKPEESELIRRVAGDEPDDVMPPAKTGKKLAPREVELLRRWVRQGAPYARHWAYVKPTRPAPPEVRDKSWPRNAVDRFILARLEAEGLAPSPEADRNTLVRRVRLDLTGLPPSPEEVDQFVNDARPDAYERLVDRLLATPAYGEHWGRLWLDLARYADSAGYADDPMRTIWAYRDYVIRSFNANIPFDRFTIEQIAGDLLPDPTEDQLVATAFHRNTLTNNEGGTNDEEFRNVAVVDRVNTTMAVWMGTTIACAQCHDHKYDPLAQREFFGLFAIFNNTEDADRKDESPTLPLYGAAQKERRLALGREIAALEKTLGTATPRSVDGEARWEASFKAVEHDRTPKKVLDILKIPPEWRNDAERKELTRHYIEAVAPESKEPGERLAGLKARLDAIKPETTVPILRERKPGARRSTRVQIRGNYLALGDAVSEGVPAAFPPMPTGAPRDRLALARWLVADDNPLTPRVIANRYWEQVFGVGLVATPEEFGAQGDQPSHPELLDWLATELVRERWDLKKFLRLLVTSAAYRQAARVTPDLVRRDPDNRLLARGPRFRLSAEMIRDQALAVAGLLSPKMHGPPVKPPQPSLGLTAAFGGSTDWTTSAGEDRHRRGIYTTWRRSNPYPSMATFDAPNREVCTIRRTRTNTPLQALVTLNDPVYVEAAQALARRMAAGASGADDRIRLGFRLALARPPADVEKARLARLHADARERFARDREAATKLATDPIGPAPKGADVAELAAWTVVANVLLNLDEMLMKR